MRLVVVIAGCGASTSPQAPPARPPPTLVATTASNVAANPISAKPIVFEWKGEQFTTDAGLSGAVTDVADSGFHVTMSNLPEGAVVSGDLSELSRENRFGSFVVEMHARLDTISVDAREVAIDPRARFTITLPDGRSGTTSVPPIRLSDRTFGNWLLGRSTTPASSIDSMAVLHVDHSLEVLGHHGTFGDIDVVATIAVEYGTSIDCTYAMSNGRRETPQKLSVRMNGARITVRDRRSDSVVATTTIPPLARCPSDLSGLDLVGPPDFPSGETLPRKAIRVWLDGWLKANARM